MATYTIGAAGPPTYDYATLQLFLADFNTGTLAGQSDVFVYGTVMETVSASIGGAVGVTGLTIQPAAGQEHTGVAGTGATIDYSTGTNPPFDDLGINVVPFLSFPITIQGMTFAGQTGDCRVLDFSGSNGPVIIRRCIFICQGGAARPRCVWMYRTCSCTRLT